MGVRRSEFGIHWEWKTGSSSGIGFHFKWKDETGSACGFHREWNKKSAWESGSIANGSGNADQEWDSIPNGTRKPQSASLRIGVSEAEPRPPHSLPHILQIRRKGEAELGRQVRQDKPPRGEANNDAAQDQQEAALAPEEHGPRTRLRYPNADDA